MLAVLIKSCRADHTELARASIGLSMLPASMLPSASRPMMMCMIEEGDHLTVGVLDLFQDKIFLSCSSNWPR